MLPNLAHRLNPIISRELRGRMRSRRVFIVLSVHVILLCLLVGIIYATVYYEGTNQAYYNTQLISVAQHGATMGSALFAGTILLLLAIFSFVAPAFGAGAIAGERERQTYDTLLLTALRSKDIILGKLGGIFTLLVLFILVSYPIQSIAYLFGGVAIPDMLIATVSLLVTAWALSAIGLYFSSLVQTTTVAVSLAYAVVIPLTYGIPFLIFFLTEGPPAYYFDAMTGWTETLYDYSLIFLMSLNSFFAAILTAEAASQGRSYFFYTADNVGPVSFQHNYWLASPWLIYIICYSLIALLLTYLAIRRLERTER